MPVRDSRVKRGRDSQMRSKDALLAIQHIDLLLFELLRSAASMLVVARTVLLDF